MKTKHIIYFLFAFSLFNINAQTPEHKWVNKIPEENKRENLWHKTYYSKIHKTKIGYNIYLPKGYYNKKNKNRKYPVIYFFHGGNPGNESRNGYHNYITPKNEIDALTPMIYVWNNGGKNESHYNFPKLNSYPETSFIEELIPHIDKTYRTIPDRSARGIQGHSMGGRAVARYIFKYPELFSVGVSIAGNHFAEKKNSENHDQFQPGDNSWDLAKNYVKTPENLIKLHVYVGAKDRNFESNVAWSAYLRTLGIHHSFTSIEGLKHREVKQMMEQIGIKTIHYMFYQNFKETIDKFNLK
ncbi:hypothetical protein A8C32_04590 [Flavivirga aquatica]|uniref:Esterase n=1 Tax=Flavivirga aquatica TaxID=1849968 RepID=A0A1E5SHD4_9FLAO|nr:alpha/beta hydrolase-fold protein [Flavivirga aquatica]OEJ98496.1 hypothetical protein A8C32_04590 [Flavivirga aquatica]